MSRVLFVNPPTINHRRITRNCDCASESKGRYLLQPFDLLYLSARLKPLDELKVIDSVALNLDQATTLREINKYNPDLIVQTMADVLWQNDVNFLTHLRQQNSKSKIYVLGDSLIEDSNIEDVSDLADDIISSPFYSFFEKENIRISQKIRSEEKFVNKKAQELILGLPRHQSFINKQYRWPFSKKKIYSSICSTWGCPYSCSYCIDSIFPNIYRNYKEIIDEMSFLQKIGISEISFTDKSFGLPQANSVSLLENMIEKKYDFSWSTYLNPNQGELEFLKLMAKAGCHTIIIGIESQDHKSLKNYKRITKAETIQSTISNAQSAGIQVCGDFLFGLNFQEKDSILKNIEYSLSLNLDFASYNIAAPLPGSQIKQEAINDGRMAVTDHHFDSVGRGRVLQARNYSSEQLLDLRNTAVKKFYLRPTYLLNRLKKTKSLEHFLIQFEEMTHIMMKSLT